MFVQSVYLKMIILIYVFFLPCVCAILIVKNSDGAILRQRFSEIPKNSYDENTAMSLRRHRARQSRYFSNRLDNEAEYRFKGLENVDYTKKELISDFDNRKTNYLQHGRTTQRMGKGVNTVGLLDFIDLNSNSKAKSKYRQFYMLFRGLRPVDNVKSSKSMDSKKFDQMSGVVDKPETEDPGQVTDLVQKKRQRELINPFVAEFKKRRWHLLSRNQSHLKKDSIHKNDEDNQITSRKKDLQNVLKAINKEVKQKSFRNSSSEQPSHGIPNNSVSHPSTANITLNVTHKPPKIHISLSAEQQILDFIYYNLTGDYTEDAVKRDHHMWTEDSFGDHSTSSDTIQKRDDAMGMSMSMNSEKDNGNMDMDMDKMKRLMEGYKYHVMLDMKSKLMLCWNVFYENKTVTFRITCQLPPDFWFGVGFSGYGEVTNADFVVFWNDPVKTHHLQDSWTDDEGVLHSDKSQDYYLKKARTEHGLSILEFSRPFDTCDDQDYLLDNGTTHIVYFTSKGTPSSCIGKDVRDLRHGFQRVQLLKPDVHLPSLPRDVWTFDITAPKVHVPGVETTYWWYITTLPQLKHKQHIVRYEGIIQKENEGIVHHIEVFHCFGSRPVKPYSGPKVPEGKMNPNSDLARCKNVIGAWAMGAEPIIYPEEAGSPIGGKDFSHYVLLEVHYHNPHLQTGHVDSSGIKFYVTPTLRPYDMGIMELGLEYTDKMAIPPHQDKFTLSGYCIADCTQLALPKDGINIFASQLHTHLTGKRVWTKHVRNGVELPEVNRDNHYSPHFQEVRVLRRPVNILPGDALITECEDITVGRRNVTFGGFSITEEMCVNYIHYYPKVNLEVCKSSISYDSLFNFFYFMKRMEGVEIEMNKGIKYNYDIIPWLPINVHLLDYVYQTSPISMQCNQSDGHRFPGSWEGVPVTKIDVPYNHHEDSCL